MNKVASFYARYQPLVMLPNELPIEKVDVADKNKQLLDFIFAVNPRTQMPSGDIACFLSADVNPQVKAFIEANLLRDIGDSSSEFSVSTDLQNKFRDVISDDDIAKYSRNNGESQEEYSFRLHAEFEKMRYENRMKASRSRLEKLLKGE